MDTSSKPSLNGEPERQDTLTTEPVSVDSYLNFVFQMGQELGYLMRRISELERRIKQLEDRDA